MNMNIEIIPSCSIAYIRQIGAYGEENIQTMEQLKHWAKANNLMNSKAVIFGIAHDNPQTTPPENYRYDACILLANGHFPADDNVQHGEFAGGKYAVFTVKHTAEAVEQAWVEIFPYYPKAAIFLTLHDRFWSVMQLNRLRSIFAKSASRFFDYCL